jgi:hypothetical protein
VRRADLVFYGLSWPREIKPDSLVAAVYALASATKLPIVIEAVGERGTVKHYVGVAAPASTVLVEQLRAAVPGLALSEDTADLPTLDLRRAAVIRLSTDRRQLNTDLGHVVAQAILGALATINRSERTVLQWLLLGRSQPRAVSDISEQPVDDSWPAELGRALLGSSPIDAEARRALRIKRSTAGWRVVGRVAVAADNPVRQRQLIHQVAAALRTAEGPGVRLHLRRAGVVDVVRRRAPWFGHSRLNVAELAVVAGWPVGKTASLPVVRQTSRAVPPSASIPKRGRVIGEATFPGRQRLLAIGRDDSCRHLWLLGPTGTGKSTLMLNLITQDVEAGRAVVVVEPKGDLIDDVLRRIPEHRRADVVLIDPSDKQAVVGLNPLAGDRSSELKADQLLAVFRGLWESFWGPRTSDILHVSLLSLAMTPGMSLAALPLLLTDPGFRRQIVGGLDEPLVLQPAWARFEAMSEAERSVSIEPVLRRVRPLLARAGLRAIFGQAEPRFDVRRAFVDRRIVLVSLGKGLLGPESAALLGSLLISSIWQAAQMRTQLPQERRSLACIYVDEMADYLNLPTDIGDALVQSRSLGVSWTLAHQHLGQLPGGLKAALMANARSRVVFQLGPDDARTLAAGDALLEVEDFRGLGRFEAYAELVASGSVQPWASLRTLPPPKPMSDPHELRALSRQAWGRSPTEVDEQLLALAAHDLATDLGPRRRRGGTP